MLIRSVFIISIILIALSNTAMAEVRISSVVTGWSKGAIEATVVEGGSWFKGRQLIHQAIIVEHTAGRLIFDTGIAARTEKSLRQAGWLDRQLYAVEKVNPLIEQLQKKGLGSSDFMAIIPSHLHWDHTGGLADFDNVPVWVNDRALQYALAEKDTIAFMQAHFEESINWQHYTLSNRPYNGFERSVDIFKDGSVVLVDLAGHTQGQVGMFVRTSPITQYFFIGDATWVVEGIYNNRPRPKITQWMSGVDGDYEENARVIEKIHKLHKKQPNLIIVPAHDEKVAATLPRFPNFGG